MDFDGLIVERPPTAGAPLDEPDRHFYEGAVMLACAMHLLRTEPVREVKIHPDGQHARQEIVGRLMMKLPGGRLVTVMPKTEVTLRVGPQARPPLRGRRHPDRLSRAPRRSRGRGGMGFGNALRERKCGRRLG
jgi:hypothetical protein